MLPLSARPLIVLAALTLLPRALLAVFLGAVGEPERWEYDVIAANIEGGSGHVYNRFGFVYAAYAPPLWSYVLAALLSLFGGARLVIQVVQALLCFAAAVTCGSLTRRITGDERAGLMAGILVALQPSLLYYSVMKSDPLPFNVLLLGLIAASATSLATGPDDRRAIAFGVLVGLGVLSRGTPIVALPVTAVALLVQGKRAALRPIALATFAFALSIAPWLIRNVAVLGAPILTSTAGENFWRGNHEGAGGGVLELSGGEITRLVPENQALPAAVRIVLARGTEVDRHEVFMTEAWRFIGSQPLSALKLFGRKLRTFWWRIDSDAGEYPHAALVAYEAIYRTELVLALLGAFTLFRPRDGASPSPARAGAALSLALMIAISVLQCAFYVQGRHRILVEPLLLMFTARAISELAQRRAKTA